MIDNDVSGNQQIVQQRAIDQQIEIVKPKQKVLEIEMRQRMKQETNVLLGWAQQNRQIL